MKKSIFISLIYFSILINYLFKKLNIANSIVEGFHNIYQS